MKLVTFAHKLYNKYNAEKGRVWRFLPLSVLSLTGLKRPYGKSELAEALKGVLGANHDISSIRSEDKNGIINAAEAALNHQFDLLGCSFALDTIEWEIDPKTGFKWLKDFYYKQRANTPNGADIKMPWELSRCHHLLWLGEAYLLTNDEKYAKEVVSQINSWIDANPLMYSVNWVCAMDVAIRAVNWMYALWMVKDSLSVTDEDARRVTISLYQHGFFVRNNFERTLPSSNNHYVSNIAGLLYIGALFFNTRRGRRWYKTAKKRLFDEILYQNLPSGVNYELSVSYHRLMTELCSYPLYVVRRRGEEVPKKVQERIQRMYQYVVEYTHNGLAPVIADNDDGRFLPFVKREPRRHDYLIDQSSLDNRIISNGTTLIAPIKNTYYGGKLYDDAGLAILRNNEAYLVLTNGGYAKKQAAINKQIGTHTHNDNLSFVFSVGADEVVIDPGTYVYTANIERRNEYRGSAKHNICVVDGEELNILSIKSAFYLRPNVIERELLIDNTTAWGHYSTIDGKLKASRKVSLAERKVTIEDILKKEGSGHQAKTYLHFASGVSVEKKENLISLETNNYWLKITITASEPIEIEIKKDTVSPSYGVEKQSKTLCISSEFDNKMEMKTIIEWESK